MKKVDWKAIGCVTKKACKTAGYVLLAAAPYVLDAKRDSGDCGNKTASYSDAISAIVNSCMLASYKQEAVALVKRDLDAEIYDAIIEVAQNNSMLASYRVDMIRCLCEK